MPFYSIRSGLEFIFIPGFGNYVVINDSNRLYYHEKPWYNFDCEIRGYVANHQLKKGDVVVDAGAYIGHYTVFAAKKVGEEGKVIAFEPIPSNFEKLRANVEMNDLSNVVLLKKGLWNSTTEVTMSDDNDISSIVSMRDGTNSIKVDAVRAEDELDKLDLKSLDFVKMDIEGAEVSALEGFGRYLDLPQTSFAIASYHYVDGVQTSGAVEDFLRSRGFNAWTGYPEHLTTYATRP